MELGSRNLDIFPENVVDDVCVASIFTIDDKDISIAGNSELPPDVGTEDNQSQQAQPLRQHVHGFTHK